jgi:hypothetical protein
LKTPELISLLSIALVWRLAFKKEIVIALNGTLLTRCLKIQNMSEYAIYPIPECALDMVVFIE